VHEQQAVPKVDTVKLADLVRQDTRESLTQALELLKAAGVSEQSAGQIRISRAGIERRIDQLKLRGLP
jgi:biotin operon repressor